MIGTMDNQALEALLSVKSALCRIETALIEGSYSPTILKRLGVLNSSVVVLNIALLLRGPRKGRKDVHLDSPGRAGV